MPNPEGLHTPIQFIKGVGPRLAERFATHDIRTVGDALFFLPRRYEDRRRVVTIRELQPKVLATFSAQVLDFAIRRTGGSSQIFELLLGDATGQITARWFHFHKASFEQRFQRGEWLRVAGALQFYGRTRQLVHPEIEKADGVEAGQPDEFACLLPIYPEIEGLYPKNLRRILRRVVEGFAAQVTEVLPKELRERRGFPDISEALRSVHVPAADANEALFNTARSPAHQRVIFEEFLLLQLGLQLRRRLFRQQAGAALALPPDWHVLAERLMGFRLTRGQERVLQECLQDMAQERPMNRLLQGDVGSGKTAVAVLAALSAARSGFQTAFMVPTEILAEQHFRRLGQMLNRSGMPCGVELLTSAVKGASRTQALQRLRSGDALLVVGTQALIEEGVGFHKLGLVVIDEQHRFGVLQRSRLRQKGHQPHVLVMTATPIPRTLAMTVYGDLDVSLLDELPPGRSPVHTVVLAGRLVRQAYQHVRREAEQGRQSYLVYPLVEESENLELRDATRMFETLKSGSLQGLRMGLLHGRMDAEEKDAVMTSFAGRGLDVLVSTSVIEVGIDVANASCIVIEHAERFGLSQLHQLRGRVGRGAHPGTCFLVAHALGSADARSRLKVMERTTDGFILAEEDLALRGPGEFLGTRQSGLPAFLFGNMSRDAELLAQAREEAQGLLVRDPQLQAPENQKLRNALWERWGQRLSLAEVG